jgi:hypothetical protein
MLVCVKTLVEAKSFEDVRNSKEWLTTSETWQYLLQHSIPTACYVAWLDCNPGTGSRFEWVKKQAEDLKKYNHSYYVTVPYADVYKRIDHVTVKDNKGNNVKFYNIATIKELIEREENLYAQLKREEKERRYASIRAAVGRSAAARKASKYTEQKTVNIPVASFSHGSCYDPEWF